MGVFRIAAGLVLCLIIPWNHSYPSPFQNNLDEDDEVDSDEQEFNRLTEVISNRLGLKNMTNKELADKASQFLTQYFNNVGTSAPLQIPNASNHTIVITIVPNSNGSTMENSFSIRIPENHVGPAEVINLPPRGVPENQIILNEVTSTSPKTIRISPALSNNGADNIEDAILEALSFAQGQVPSNVASPSANIKNKVQSTVISPTQNPSSSFSISAAIPISPLSPQNTGAVYVPEATTVRSNSHFEQKTPPPLLLVLPAQEPPKTGTASLRPLFLALNVLDSLSEGDLGGAVENTFKLSETPVVQDTARLAAVGLINNVFQGFNCQFLGNCNSSPLKILVP